MIVLPEEISRYVEVIVGSVGSTAESIWLFGSRANGSATASSDWDLVLFGSAVGLAALRAKPGLQRPDVDLLVGPRDGVWEGPWLSDDKGFKRGSAELFNWRETSEDTAEYSGEPSYPDGPWWKSTARQELLKAYKVWP